MNLETDYLGLKLAHPIIPGASPFCDNLDQVRRLEDAGAPAIVMHSLFEEQILQEGLAHQLYREQIEDSFSEAASFFPDAKEFVLGPEQYLAQIQRIKEAVKIPVIASLNGAHPGGWIDYARKIEEAGAAALELNIYFQPTDLKVTGAEVEWRLLEVVRSVKAAVKIPVAVKLSPFYSSLPQIAVQLKEVGADAMILFNRFFQPDFDIENLEVRARLELSSPAELATRLQWTAILAERSDMPLVVSGGVHSYTDVAKSLMAGATAVQVVSCLLKWGPSYLTTLVNDLKHFMEEQDYRSIDQMRGNLSLKRCPNPEVFERINYLRTLQLWRV